MTKRDRIRYPNTLGILSVTSVVLGSYATLGSKISELPSCLALHCSVSHLSVVQYKRSNVQLLLLPAQSETRHGSSH